MCIYFYTLVNKFNICFLFFLAVQIYMIFFEKLYDQARDSQFV
jgi:hypothetical protein